MDQRADAGDEQDPRDRQRVGEEADVDPERAGRDPREEVSTVLTRASSGRLSIATNITTDHTNDSADRARWRSSPPSARRCACRRSSRITAPSERQRRDDPERDRGDRVASTGCSPSAGRRRRRSRRRRRRKMATMMASPTATSAAATTSVKNTIAWPRMSLSVVGERHEREVRRVEHELDAHEHHEHVAADEQADRADREEHRGERQVVGRGEVELDGEGHDVVTSACAVGGSGVGLVVVDARARTPSRAAGRCGGRARPRRRPRSRAAPR